MGWGGWGPSGSRAPPPPPPPPLQPPQGGGGCRGWGGAHRCLGSCSVPAPAPSHLSAPVRVNKSFLLGFISSERPCIISADKGNIPLNDKPWESAHAYCITSFLTLAADSGPGHLKTSSFIQRAKCILIKVTPYPRRDARVEMGDLEGEKIESGMQHNGEEKSSKMSDEIQKTALSIPLFTASG